MKKIIFRFNYVFLFAIALMFCVQAQAQIPKIDGKDGGKIDVSGGGMHPALKKAIADKAAIDKILNATVSKVEMRIENIPHPIGVTSSKYSTTSVDLKENNGGTFALLYPLSYKMVRTNPHSNKNEAHTPYTETYSLSPFTSSSYRSLLANGFLAKIDFTGAKYQITYKYEANFVFIFYFSDGNKAEIYLQPIEVLAKKYAYYKANKNGEVHVLKNIPGSDFPDPENPFVLPPVK